MERTHPDSHLRSVVAENIDRLNQSRGGRYLSTIARRLGVERSTVSRWRQRATTASPEHCEALARHWPDFFEHDELVNLHFESLQGDHQHPARTAGVEVIDNAADLYSAMTNELMNEPTRPSERTIRHTAFHIERTGRDPIKSDELFNTVAGKELSRFRDLLVERARQGWTIRLVVSSGRAERIESIANMVRALDGPNVEMWGYAHELPLVMSPVVIGSRTLVIVHDHRRWERPGSAIIVRSRAAAAWAENYHAELIADAPFRLRHPAGVDEVGLAAWQKAIGRNAR